MNDTANNLKPAVAEPGKDGAVGLQRFVRHFCARIGNWKLENWHLYRLQKHTSRGHCKNPQYYSGGIDSGETKSLRMGPVLSTWLQWDRIV